MSVWTGCWTNIWVVNNLRFDDAHWQKNISCKMLTWYTSYLIHKSKVCDVSREFEVHCRIITLPESMMTSSNGNIFRVTGPLCGEFTGPGEFPTQRPVTRSFDVFFDLRLNKRLSKQPRGWWFETQSWSLWRHCNAMLTQKGGTRLLYLPPCENHDVTWWITGISTQPSHETWNNLIKPTTFEIDVVQLYYMMLYWAQKWWM